MKRYLFLALVIAGCGGGDDKAPAMMAAQTPAPANMYPTPAQQAAAVVKCETFMNTWCARSADCWGAVDPSFSRSELIAECTSAFKSSIDCGAAVAVSESFDRCLRDMAAMTCTAVMADPPGLPAACNGAVLVK